MFLHCCKNSLIFGQAFLRYVTSSEGLAYFVYLGDRASNKALRRTWAGNLISKMQNCSVSSNIKDSILR